MRTCDVSLVELSTARGDTHRVGLWCSTFQRYLHDRDDTSCLVRVLLSRERVTSVRPFRRLPGSRDRKTHRAPPQSWVAKLCHRFCSVFTCVKRAGVCFDHSGLCRIALLYGLDYLDIASLYLEGGEMPLCSLLIATVERHVCMCRRGNCRE